MFYVYRTTTDKLGDGLNHVIESGHQIVERWFQGGRDWTLLCHKSAPRRDLDPAMLVGTYRDLS